MLMIPSQRMSIIDLMKVTVLSLNPAVDLTVYVDQFEANTVNRASVYQQFAGGKGVNVASFLSDLGLDVSITGFLGNENIAIFEQLFMDRGITDRCVRVPGMTRTGIKIVDDLRQETTDINLPGLHPSEEAIEQLWAEIHQMLNTSEWLILTGSLPPGMPADFYTTVIQFAKHHGRKTVLDTSGHALRSGIQASPSMIKPNLSELADIFDDPLLSIDQTSHTDSLIPLIYNRLIHQVDQVIVSLGEKGALYVDKNTVCEAAPVHVQVHGTVGAGDAMVAGLVAAQAFRLSPDKSLRLATACSLAIVAGETRRLPNIETLMNTWADQITIFDHKPA